MIFKKKNMRILTAILMLFILVACGDGSKKDSPAENNNQHDIDVEVDVAVEIDSHEKTGDNYENEIDVDTAFGENEGEVSVSDTDSDTEKALCRNNTFYVSPNGNDSNSGTQLKPWLTPQFAADSATAGDCVIFQDGEYSINHRVVFKNAGEPENPILFKAANRHQARFVGPIDNEDDVYSIFGVFRYIGGEETYEDTDYYLIFDGLDIEGGYDHAIQIAGANRVTIHSCRLHGSGRDAVKNNSGSDHNLIENCEIFSTGLRDDSNAEGIDATSSEYLTIRGNHIYDVPHWGIYVKKQSRNAVIEKNVIHDCGYGISMGQSSLLYDSIARNNILYDIDYACLQHQGAKRCRIYNNTCYNVAIKGWSGLRVGDADSESTPEGETPQCEDVEFINNIIVINSEDRFLFQGTSDAMRSFDDLTLKNNLYFNLNPSKRQAFRYEGESTEELENWQTWTSETSDTGKMQDENSLYGDPLFLSTNPDSSDFLRLSPSSAGIDAGMDLSDYLLDDFDGNGRLPGSFDMGAFESK